MMVYPIGRICSGMMLDILLIFDDMPIIGQVFLGSEVVDALQRVIIKKPKHSIIRHILRLTFANDVIGV